MRSVGSLLELPCSAARIDQARLALATWQERSVSSSAATQWIDSFERDVAAAIATAATVTSSTRPGLVDTLDALLREGRAKHEQHGVAPLDVPGVPRLRVAIARVSLVRALLDVRIEGPGLGRVVFGPSTAGDAVAALEGLDDASVPRIRSLFATSDIAAFYGSYHALSSSPGPLAHVLLSLSAALPRPQVGPRLEAIRVLPLPELLADRGSVERDLRHVQQLGTVNIASVPLASAPEVALAHALATSIARVCAVRPLLLRFSSSDLVEYHLDLSTSADGPFEAANWPLDEGGRTGCIRRVRGAPGGVLYVVPNWWTKEHVVTDQHGAPCSRTPVSRLVIDRPKGAFELAGRMVNFEIVEGWPEWPPATSSTH
jgi:hypothetical protein